jgi:hypothetical protein
VHCAEFLTDARDFDLRAIRHPRATSPVRVSPDLGTRDEDPTVLLADDDQIQPGSARAAYFRDTSAEVVMATSSDGRSWSTPRVVSPADSEERYVDFSPHAFESQDGTRLFIAWTSSRSDRLGDILVREVSAPAPPILQLTETDEGDYGGRVAPTSQPGEFVLVWTGIRSGHYGIWARRFVP